MPVFCLLQVVLPMLLNDLVKYEECPKAPCPEDLDRSWMTAEQFYAGLGIVQVGVGGWVVCRGWVLQCQAAPCHGHHGEKTCWNMLEPEQVGWDMRALCHHTNMIVAALDISDWIRSPIRLDPQSNWMSTPALMCAPAGHAWSPVQLFILPGCHHFLECWYLPTRWCGGGLVWPVWPWCHAHVWCAALLEQVQAPAGLQACAARYGSATNVGSCVAV